MHTPSALAARPLPKRTRSTAGLEEIDAWLGQITSSSTSTIMSTSTTPSLTAAVTAVRDPSLAHGGGASRKRHHSLPASVLAGSFQALAAASNANVNMKTKSTASTPASASASTRRPDLALFAAEALHQSSHQGSSFVNTQYSPTTPYSFLQPLQSAPSTHNAGLSMPEMSPREDFLIRAFVSDAMKLEGGGYDDGHSHSPSTTNGAFALPPPRAIAYPPSSHASQPQPPLEPLEVPTRAMNMDGSNPTADDSGATTPTSTATTLTPSPTPTASHPHHKWTRDEDEKLRDAVTRFGGKSWKLIAEMLGNGRTDVQCLHRWNKVLKPGLVKGPWTPEEDRILLSLIARYGVGQIRWCDVALHLPGRIGKQCRERWCNHLDSTIRKGQWTPQEDDTVFRLQQTIGNKWSEIAKHLPGRTENAVKNRFNSAARRKWILSQANAAAALSGNGLVSSLPTTPSTTTTVTGGKAPRHSQQHQRLRQTSLARGGRGPLPRTSSGFLPIDLLAGPPRPPPLPVPMPVTTPFRGVAYSATSFSPLDGAGNFRPAADASSPLPFAFGDNDDLHHAGAYHPAADAGSVTSGLRPAFNFHASHFPQASAAPLFRPQFLSTSTASPSPPPLQEKKNGEPEERAPHDDALDGLAMEEEDGDDSGDGSQDNQSTHSPSRRDSMSTITTPSSDGGDKRRLSLDASSKHGDPQVDDEEDGGDDALRAIDQQDDGHGGSGGLVDMDDQNMSTFLDSVALELDDML